MTTFIVREMLATDSSAVAQLMPDLGYQATPSQVHERFILLTSRPDNAFFVAESDGQIVGWSHVYGVRLLESDGYAEIGGLVVASSFQRNGAGTKIIRISESWAADKGYARIRLRSGIHREGAHLFYESRGYKKSNVSYAFELNI